MAIKKPGTLAIEAIDLKKKYEPDILAVNGLDLKIEKGSIYALLGPNGAGKTTTISILTTIFQPTGGVAKVAGYDVVKEPKKVREKIGVTFQETLVDEALTGRQTLDFHGQLYGMSRSQRKKKIKELLHHVELEDAADRKAKTYSGGMKRRLELIRGLMTGPEILFLDEPTLGLDPQNRTKIWDYILSMRDTFGVTILFTTHYLEEAEKLADRVGIVDHGKVVAEGTPGELIDQMGSDVIFISTEGDISAFVAALEETPYVGSVSTCEGGVQLGVDNWGKRIAKIASLGSRLNVKMGEVTVSKPDLGDVFIKFTGRELRDK